MDIGQKCELDEQIRAVVRLELQSRDRGAAAFLAARPFREWMELADWLEENSTGWGTLTEMVKAVIEYKAAEKARQKE